MYVCVSRVLLCCMYVSLCVCESSHHTHECGLSLHFLYYNRAFVCACGGVVGGVCLHGVMCTLFCSPSCTAVATLFDGVQRELNAFALNESKVTNDCIKELTTAMNKYKETSVTFVCQRRSVMFLSLDFVCKNMRGFTHINVWGVYSHQCVCMFFYISVHLHICVRVLAHQFISSCVCVCVLSHQYMYTCVYMCVCVCVFVFVCSSNSYVFEYVRVREIKRGLSFNEFFHASLTSTPCCPSS